VPTKGSLIFRGNSFHTQKQLVKLTMDDDPLAIPLILDAGTFNLKAGLNESDTPTLCLQTIIGTIFVFAPD